MNVSQPFYRRAFNRLTGRTALINTAYAAEANLGLVQERIAALELALEDSEYIKLSSESTTEFSRSGLARISEYARIMFIKNPLIKRGINVRRYYTFGQGVNIAAQQEEIQALINAFNEDLGNKRVLTSHQARMEKEIELETDGNLFFVFHTNMLTGGVKIRSIPFAEIQDIVLDPNDKAVPQFYKRTYTKRSMNFRTGGLNEIYKVVYYPDWNHRPASRPATMNKAPIMWDQPIFHMKAGGFSDHKFGIPEVYASLDWAKAYKKFLENVASMMEAYARFAWTFVPGGGKKGIDAAKTAWATTVSRTSGERNPPPNTGATLISNNPDALKPVMTRGAGQNPEDGRRLLLMVAAAFGLPETFFGDVSVGTLATASALDRPTELSMRDRQTLWSDAYKQIYNFVIIKALRAINPDTQIGRDIKKLGVAALVTDPITKNKIDLVKWKAEVKADITVDFPPIIESSVAAMTEAIATAATLNGNPLAGTMDLKTISRMLLNALGEEDIDKILERLFDEDGNPTFSTDNPASEDPAAALATSMREVSKHLSGFRAAKK